MELKKFSIRFFFVLFLLCFSLKQSFAQENENFKLAIQYFENNEFDKALPLFEKEYQNNPSDNVYTYLSSCTIQLKDYSKAEKVIKKQIKKQGNNYKYQIDLGNLYVMMFETEKAQKSFEKAIDVTPSQQAAFINTAKAFIAIKQTEFALKTYLKGKEKLSGLYPFSFEIAEVYSLLGNYSKMIEEYLNALEFSEALLSQVQGMLQTFLNEKENTDKVDLFKEELLKKIQQQPSKIVFYDMLVWQLQQELKFDMALDQLKALDKRVGNQEQKIIQLAQICITNSNFKVAALCFKYIIDKGPQNPFYQVVRQEYVNAMYQKILNAQNYTKADIEDLKRAYISLLNEFKYNYLFKVKLAHLYAFYIHNLDTSIVLLNEVVNAQTDPNVVAQGKLELGDVYLLTGEVWESSLLYSQVEKAFKHDIIGQEAKYKNAKLSFYKGDFSWAKTQLGVLKAATSKLIANDALYLDLLIIDNLGTDSVSAPLSMYATADLLQFQNQDSLSLLTLDSINNMFPENSLNDDILFKKYQISYKQQNFEKAKLYLNELIEKYYADILADDAVFELAKLYEINLKNSAEAMKMYEKIILEYPGSIYVNDARIKFRTLRGDKLN
jgi:tetratricopeptide (TPR) repeat protein